MAHSIIARTVPHGGCGTLTRRSDLASVGHDAMLGQHSKPVRWVMYRPQTKLKTCPISAGKPLHLGSVGLNAVLIHSLQHCAAASAADGVPAVRVEVQPLRQRLRDFWRCNHRCQGQAISDALHLHILESNVSSSQHTSSTFSHTRSRRITFCGRKDRCCISQSCSGDQHGPGALPKAAAPEGFAPLPW